MARLGKNIEICILESEKSQLQILIENEKSNTQKNKRINKKLDTLNDKMLKIENRMSKLHRKVNSLL